MTDNPMVSGSEGNRGSAGPEKKSVDLNRISSLFKTMKTKTMGKEGEWVWNSWRGSKEPKRKTELDSVAQL